MNQLTIYDTATAPTALESASLWVAANPEAWRYMKAQARAAAERGHRFGMKQLAEHVRWHFAVNRTDRSYGLNNNIVAPLARLLVAECPDVRPYMEMRRTSLDGIGSPNTRPERTRS